MHIEAFCALRATSHLPNIPQEGPVDPDQIGCIDLVRLAAPTSLAPVLFSFWRESHTLLSTHRTLPAWGRKTSQPPKGALPFVALGSGPP